MRFDIIRIADRPDMAERTAQWFHSKWGIPLEAYAESITDCIRGDAPVPQWYAAVQDGVIIGGVGVIENDFHNRRELAPNVCALYVNEDMRCRGIAGALLDFACGDMEKQGIDTLYLLTDHTLFYERYGWEFFCMVQGNGEPHMSRMYIRRPVRDTGVTIARAVPEDAGAILAFLRCAEGGTDRLSFGAKGMPLSVEAMAESIAAMGDGSLMLVAKKDGEIVANASLACLPHRACRRGEVSVAVARERLDCGIGGMLLSRLVDLAYQSGCHILDATVRSDDAAAIRLCEQHGFRQMFTRPGYFNIGDTNIDGEYMCLRMR